MADWGGGLGGSGFACRLCEFVTLTKDSLVTHAGYKHALFVQFMPENIQKDFLEVAKSCGENTDSWDLGNNTENVEEKEKENEKEEEEKTVFDNQLTLPSQMTNINCSLETPSPTKCLECDFQVSLSQLNYRLFFAFESFSFLQFFRVFPNFAGFFSNFCDFFRVFIFYSFQILRVFFFQFLRLSCLLNFVVSAIIAIIVFFLTFAIFVRRIFYLLFVFKKSHFFFSHFSTIFLFYTILSFYAIFTFSIIHDFAFSGIFTFSMIFLDFRLEKYFHFFFIIF